VAHDKDLNDDMLGWKTRAALRAGNTPKWALVESSINAMSADARKDPTWIYWHARALLARKKVTPQVQQEATAALESIAGVRGFYEQLALEELGRKVTTPARPPAPTSEEMDAARRNPSLQRALYAIGMGLRSEGVREWNYATNLVDAQGKAGMMSDRELLAAAQHAAHGCRQVGQLRRRGAVQKLLLPAPSCHFCTHSPLPLAHITTSTLPPPPPLQVAVPAAQGAVPAGAARPRGPCHQPLPGSVPARAAPRLCSLSPGCLGAQRARQGGAEDC
jgi:hypothetical protein